MKRLTQAQVVKDFRAVHGSKYDYSKVVYTGARDKVLIVCKDHGVFSQAVTDHKSGKGCGKCAGQGLTNRERIEDLINSRGGRYDYSKVNYINAKTPIIVICKEHGEFSQNINSHKLGSNCPLCVLSKKSELVTLSQDEIIKHFHEAHGSKYDYSLVDYVHGNHPVKIICKDHGVFSQTPNNHKIGSGCQVCGGHKQLTQDQAIAQFKEVHGELYDYSMVEYSRAEDKVNIICKVHGVFKQRPNSHSKGMGCWECSVLVRANLAATTQTKIVEQFRDTHGNLYNYSLVNYVNAFTKVKIICKDHGVFEQRPSDHRGGQGCSSCAKTGFNPSKAGTLYYLSINNGQAYKIGITNYTVQKRFSIDDMEKIQVIKTWHYEIGEDAYMEEQHILREFKYAKWSGDNLLADGNTELFDRDILGLEILHKNISA